jgi:branched-chain amino acid transport system ATP-binding protein
MATALLELKNVHTYYGNIHALKGISLTVNQGEIIALIGGNGAGKTTTLRTICGQQRPKMGEVVHKGQPLAGVPVHQMITRGIAHVPEGRRIFPQLTIRENLEMGAFSISDKKFIADRIELGFSLFPRLREREKQLGGTLSGGEQQMLAVARALMQDPEIILLDEPSMGLSPLFVEKIFEIIEMLNKQGKTILLVEQNALMALEVAHRGYVIQTGEIVLTDDAKALAKNEMVRKAYLGED